MEKNRNRMTERILDLTLEIIYLLTGEDHKVVRKISGEPLALNSRPQRTSPIMVPSGHSPTPEISSDQKILEVTQKIIDLLTGEVPIRCQDVSLYFSKEDWEYLGGHRDLYKDVVMESEPPLTSPDGSSKRNPPERCPRPLYSRDSTQEHHTVPHQDQHDEQMYMKVEVKEQEEEEMSVMGYRQTTEKVGIMVKIKQEEPSLDISTDGSSKRNPPERCPRPLYSRDSTQEDLTVPHHDQGEELKDIKVEVKEEEEEMLVSGVQQSMEEGEMNMKSKQEESSLHIDTYGRCVQKMNTSEGDLSPSPDSTEDNRSAQYSPRTNSSSHNLHHRHYYLGRSMDPSNPEEPSGHSHHMTSDVHLKPHNVERSTDPSNSKESSSGHEGVQKVDHSLSCSVCGKTFTKKKALLRHQRAHTGQYRFSCSECGKCFDDRAKLLRHHRMHTGERPFPCSECGKCFAQKEYIIIHQRIHTGERPFSCSVCGKSFIDKRLLIKHQKLHTGERPFSCSDCGKSYTERVRLLRHQKVHTGAPFFSCSDCGKHFTQKGNLTVHQRTHTGDRPFSCPECGKCFTEKRILNRHQKVHSIERSFSCSTCGESFTQKGKLTIHKRIHTG